jgi:hypothetical protein
MNPFKQDLSAPTQTVDIWQCLLAAQDVSRLTVPRDGVCWQSLDGQTVRIHAPRAPDEGHWPWLRLQGLAEFAGASHGQAVTHHYVVETDVESQHEAELNDWYQNEHMPGLAAVPGTVRARRYLRTEGRPKWVACYDLTSPETLSRPEWLAVRHTDWSSKVRPLFQNTYRTMYRLIAA